MTGYQFVMQQFSNNKLILQPVSNEAPNSSKKLMALNVATINIVTTY